MDISTFYAVTSATCFTLVGLWWTVVKDRPDWRQDPDRKRLAGGVYTSFLLPGVMSLAAQIGADRQFLWRGVFVIAALAGLVFSSRLIDRTRAAQPTGAFSRNGWIVPALYGLILFFAVLPGLAVLIGLQGLQLEALLLSGLIVCAHWLAWEFSMST